MPRHVATSSCPPITRCSTNAKTKSTCLFSKITLLIVMIVTLLCQGEALSSVKGWGGNFHLKWQLRASPDQQGGPNNDSDIEDGAVIVFENSNKKRRVGVIDLENDMIYNLRPYGLDFEEVSGQDEWWSKLAVDPAADLELYHGHDDSEDVSLTSTDTLRVLKVLNVSLTQRICEDRVENPHGEHAEDCYIVRAEEFGDVEMEGDSV